MIVAKDQSVALASLYFRHNQTRDEKTPRFSVCSYKAGAKTTVIISSDQANDLAAFNPLIPHSPPTNTRLDKHAPASRLNASDVPLSYDWFYFSTLSSSGNDASESDSKMSISRQKLRYRNVPDRLSEISKNRGTGWWRKSESNFRDPFWLLGGRIRPEFRALLHGPKESIHRPAHPLHTCPYPFGEGICIPKIEKRLRTSRTFFFLSS